MPPKKDTSIRDHFFNYDAENDCSTCKLCQPEVTITGDHKGNLVRHLKNDHLKEFVKFERQAKQVTESQQTEITQFGVHKALKKKIEVIVPSDIIEKSVLKLITVDGRPFKSVEDASFQGLIKPIQSGLRVRKVIDRKYSKSLIKEKASLLREKLSAVLEKNVVSLKMDGGERKGRRFIGVNLQFRDEKDLEFKIFTLGCIELQESSTSEYLKEILENILSTYNIDKSKIYCICTDNGANYTKCVRLLRNEYYKQQEMSKDSPDDEFDFDDIEEFTIDDPQDEELINRMISECADNLNFFNIRCLEHTFQLALKSWMDDGTIYSDVLNKAKKLVVKLRTTNIQRTLRKIGFKKQIKGYVDTRWGSTYIMLKRLLEAEEYVKKIDDYLTSEEYGLTDAEWCSLKELSKILEPCYRATIQFQTQNAILSELYKMWIECDVALEKLGSQPANDLRLKLTEKETILFCNVSFQTALYLDPRFKTLLSDIQKSQVKQHVFNLIKRFQIQLENDSSDDDGVFIQEDEPSVSSGSKKQKQSNTKKRFKPTSEKEREAAIAICERVKQKSKSVVKETGVDDESLEEEIKEYDTKINMTADKTQNDVFKFWLQEKSRFKLLYSVTPIIFGIPGTEVSAEALFSEMKFILDDHRLSLNESSVDDILTIRRNFDLL